MKISVKKYCLQSLVYYKQHCVNIEILTYYNHTFFRIEFRYEICRLAPPTISWVEFNNFEECYFLPNL